MTSIKEFTVSSARQLPVVIMADTSGSMAADSKIDSLNLAMGEMIQSFAEEEEGRAELHAAVITFGGTAQLHTPLTPARQVEWSPMHAGGMTPLGGALTIATEIIEDREQVPRRAYTPTVILVSDGQPNDEWQRPLERFLSSERAKKAQRFALAIGEDADHDVLKKFLADPEGRVFSAHEAREIRRFFQWVTMSVTSRSRSATPNTPVSLDPLDLDEYEDF